MKGKRRKDMNMPKAFLQNFSCRVHTLKIQKKGLWSICIFFCSSLCWFIYYSFNMNPAYDYKVWEWIGERGAHTTLPEIVFLNRNEKMETGNI